jgi:hypothetical protein
MSEYAETEEPAYPYWPEPIGPCCQDHEGREYQDIDDKDPDLDGLKPGYRSGGEQDKTCDASDRVGYGSQSLRHTPCYEGVQARWD